MAKGRSRFTPAERDLIRELLERVRTVSPPQQKPLRGRLRDAGFYITDWGQSSAGFTVEDFDNLVREGAITIDGEAQGGSKPTPEINRVNVGWLIELLTEISGSAEVRESRSSDPFGAELLFDGWVTIQRIALGKSGDQLALCAWPGELKGQAEAFYDGERVRGLVRFLDAHGEWQATPKPHLAYPFAKFPEVLYLPAKLGTRDYLERWSEPDALERIGPHDPDTVRSQLWPWLLEQGFSDQSPAEDGSLDSYLERVARRPSALMRPGLEMRREWGWSESQEIGRESLVGELRESLRELLTALDEPGLPR